MKVKAVIFFQEADSPCSISKIQSLQEHKVKIGVLIKECLLLERTVFFTQGSRRVHLLTS